MKNIIFICLYVLFCAGFTFHAGADECSGTGVIIGNDNQCVCDQGYYGDGVTCTYCPTGYTTSGPGALGVSECSLCDKGYYEDGGTCKPCPPHKYKDSVGNGQCETCPAGQYNNQYGAEGCLICPVGHCCAYGDKFLCKKGTYKDGSDGECRPITYTTVNTRGHSSSYEDYIKGMCKKECNAGCTTSGVGATSNNDCTVKRVRQFCILSDNRNVCFSWPDDTSISEQTLNSNIVGKFSCPGGVQS